MKLIEQYLEAIGRKLPFGGREDVKRELRSLLQDDIEARFGPEPNEEQVKSTLKDFGSPTTVARRYGKRQDIIVPGLAPLYYLLLQIVLGALAIAFFVLFVLTIVEAIVNPEPTVLIGAAFIFTGLGRFIMSTLSAYFGAVGVITLIFIGISRREDAASLDSEADWSPNELADIELGLEPVSRVSSIVSIAILAALTLLINLYPQIFSAAEDLFAQSTTLLGHRLELARFALYARLLALVWLIEMAYHVALLAANTRTRLSGILERVAYGAAPLVLGLLVVDAQVYAGSGFTGFRLVFVIVFCIALAELIGLLYREIKAYIDKKAA